jgi:hypothetical protein
VGYEVDPIFLFHIRGSKLFCVKNSKNFYKDKKKKLRATKSIEKIRVKKRQNTYTNSAPSHGAG